MLDSLPALFNVGLSLAVGLLIGIERGWHQREEKEGARVAGVRTLGLIGLLGGTSALLVEKTSPLTVGLAFIGLTGLLTAVHIVNLPRRGDVGITSIVAAMLAFVLGAMATSGAAEMAAAGAVVTTLVLSAKPVLHHWLEVLDAKELDAGIKLLLVSIVLLPVLPNHGYGPWQTLNPYEIWLMVVIIATVSFLGYFAIRIGGTRRGSIFAGLFGGLASSTALTLDFSRRARMSSDLAPALSVGVLLACGTMFLRCLLITGLLNKDLILLLALPTVTMAALTYGTALYFWRKRSGQTVDATGSVQNPLNLKDAIQFGLVLALVMLLSKALQTWGGHAGLLAIAAASGIADVDAITISLTRMSTSGLDLNTAAAGVIGAVAANSITKAIMAAFVGGREMGLRVGIPLLISAIAGPIVAWLT